MKKYIQCHLLKIASVLSIFTTLPTPIALADSVYDGIWQAGYGALDGAWTPENLYYSITIKDSTILIVDLHTIATYKNTLNGAFFGSLPTNINLIPSPSSNNRLSIRVTLDQGVREAMALNNPFPGLPLVYSRKIEFTSKDSAILSIPQEDYKNIDFLPGFILKKIF